MCFCYRKQNLIMPFWIDKNDVFQRLYAEGFFSVAFRVDVKENLLK